jgi:hypothetical protein
MDTTPPPPPTIEPLHMPLTDRWLTGREAEVARQFLADAEQRGLTGSAAWGAAGRALAARRRTEPDEHVRLRMGHAALDLRDEAARSGR